MTPYSITATPVMNRRKFLTAGASALVSGFVLPVPTRAGPAQRAQAAEPAPDCVYDAGNRAQLFIDQALAPREILIEETPIPSLPVCFSSLIKLRSDLSQTRVDWMLYG